MKTCSKCGATHPIAYFNRDRTRPDGLYPRCKDCSRKDCRVSYRAHETDHRALKQRWKARNQERHREINAAWRRDNPDRVRTNTAWYRTRLKRATLPGYDDKELLAFIRSECPPGWHVDHIYPLDGENSCGLNVPWNLQYLPADVHRKKGRKNPEHITGGYSDV